jgi:hypothetical protein
LISVLGALIDTEDPEQIQATMDSLVDVVGYCYRFGLADSVLNELKYR